MYKLYWTGSRTHSKKTFKSDDAALNHAAKVKRSATVKHTDSGATVATYSPRNGVVWFVDGYNRLYYNTV